MHSRFSALPESACVPRSGAQHETNALFTLSLLQSLMSFLIAASGHGLLGA